MMKKNYDKSAPAQGRGSSTRPWNRSCTCPAPRSGGNVRAKKNLGQHFLTNTDIARVIARCVHPAYTPALMPDGSLDFLEAGSLSRDAREFAPSAASSNLPAGSSKINVLEIGPGMGVLSRCLWEDASLEVKMVELDAESVVYLASNFPEHTRQGQLIPGDFLKMDLDKLFVGQEFVLTGNFPYNISSQILFRVLENKERIPLMEGMFQKEVGERVCARPGSKSYGILSVLLQAYYDTRYLFTVEPDEFNPPPQVRSCVIRMTRKDSQELGCDREVFTYLVKKAFNQRRKALRNALKGMEDEKGLCSDGVPEEFLGLRAEQLSVEDYVRITQCLKKM